MTSVVTIQAICLLGAIAWFYFVLRKEVLRDYTSWKAGRYTDINHRRGWIRRAYWLTPCIGLLTLGMRPHDWQLLVAGPLSAVVSACIWWFFFDGWFNSIRGFNWWYTGTNDPNDAHTDDFVQGLRKWQHITIKIGLNILLLIVYIILL